MWNVENQDLFMCIGALHMHIFNHALHNIYIYTYLTKIFFLQGQSGGEFGGMSLNAVVWETSTTSTLFRLFLGSSDATRPVVPCECSAKLLETREVQFCIFLVMGQAFTIIHYCILYLWGKNTKTRIVLYIFYIKRNDQMMLQCAQKHARDSIDLHPWYNSFCVVLVPEQVFECSFMAIVSLLVLQVCVRMLKNSANVWQPLDVT